jgi:hypothetical protein
MEAGVLKQLPPKKISIFGGSHLKTTASKNKFFKMSTL